MSPRKPRRKATYPAALELRRCRESSGLSQAELGTLTGYSPKTIARWERGESAVREAVLKWIQSSNGNGTNGNGHGPGFTFVDLFAGIGGMRLGFERAGGKCVFTSEWDKYAQITYRANFGESHPIAGDIRQIPSELLPPHDVLLAGFPCQPFSIAGVSKKNALGRPHGFACEAQGTLFFEVARIIRDRRPRAFLLENVKNLKSHDGGRTFGVITKTLREELGYSVFPLVVDAKRFVPQHRERIFLVGFRDPLADFDWGELAIRPLSIGPKLASILHPQDGTEHPAPPFTDESGRVAKKYQLSNDLWTYLKNYADKHQKMGNGFGFGLVGPDDIARTLSARYYKDGSEILVRTRRGPPRRLTPRECARLMGFDSPGRPPFKILVSDTQAYKQFGNAVVVPVVEAIARRMSAVLAGHETSRLQLALPLKAVAT